MYAAHTDISDVDALNKLAFYLLTCLLAHLLSDKFRPIPTTTETKTRTQSEIWRPKSE